jgi:hypothetical protein
MLYFEPDLQVDGHATSLKHRSNVATPSMMMHLTQD